MGVSFGNITFVVYVFPGGKYELVKKHYYLLSLWVFEVMISLNPVMCVMR